MAKAKEQLERVILDVRPDTKLNAQVQEWKAKALQIVVDSPLAARAAKETLAGIQALRRKIAAHYAEIKRPLNDAIAKVREMEKRDVDPLLDAERSISGRVSDYELEEERRRRREAEAEAERKRKDEEERRKREEEALRAQAKATRKRDDKAALNDMADAIAAAPLPQPIVEVKSVKAETKIDDMIERKTWSGEVVDFAAFVRLVAEGKAPIDALKINDGWLYREAVKWEGRLGDIFPGLKATSKTSYVSRGPR